MNSKEQFRLNQFLNKDFNNDAEISKNSSGFGMGLFISNLLAEKLMKSKRAYGIGGGIFFEFGEGFTQFYFFIKTITLANIV